MKQFLLDYGELISITLMPFIILGLGTYFQDRKSKKDAQLGLFLDLMKTRGSIPISPIWVNSLNQIDIVFQKDKKIRNAWRAYYDSLDEKSQHFDMQGSFQLDLLSEIANFLGYKNLKQTEIARFYSPKYHGNSVTRESVFYEEYLRVLSRSKNLAQPFSEEEYKNHLQILLMKYPNMNF